MVENLTDEELTRRLEELAGDQRRLTFELLEHLGEFDKRRLAELGALPSTFAYCVRRLGFSEAEAYLRIHAARAMRDHPKIKPRVREGAYTVTALSMLRPFMTLENCEALMEEARGKSRLDLEIMAAKLKAARPVRAAAAPAGPSVPDELPLGAEPRIERVPASDPVPARRDMTRVETPESFRIAFSADAAFLRKLERAKEVLRNKYPFARLEEVLGQGLDDTLDRRDPDRVIARAEKRAAKRAARSPKKNGTKEPPEMPDGPIRPVRPLS